MSRDFIIHVVGCCPSAVGPLDTFLHFVPSVARAVAMPHVLFRSGECTPRTQVVIPGPESYDFIYNLALDAGERFSWRGRPPVRTVLEEVCWTDTYEHAVIIDRSSRSAIGYATLTRMNTHHGTVYLSVYLTPDARLTGYPLEAVALLLRRLMQFTDCRKVYTESFGPSQASEAYRDNQLFSLEGRLREYLRVRGEFWDLIICGATRESILKGTSFIERWEAG